MLRKIINTLIDFFELILTCALAVITMFFVIIAIGVLAMLAILYVEILRDLIPFL